MSLDHGTLNVPLSKRGDIDAQIDRYKAAKAKEAAVQRKTAATSLRESKAAAKIALAELLADPAVLDQKAASMGVARKKLIAQITGWSKWEPAHMLKLHKQWLPADGA